VENVVAFQIWFFSGNAQKCLAIPVRVWYLLGFFLLFNFDF